MVMMFFCSSSLTHLSSSVSISLDQEVQNLQLAEQWVELGGGNKGYHQFSIGILGPWSGSHPDWLAGGQWQDG